MDFDLATELLKERVEKHVDDRTMVRITPFDAAPSFNMMTVLSSKPHIVFIQPLVMSPTEIDGAGAPLTIEFRFGISVFTKLTKTGHEELTAESIERATKILKTLDYTARDSDGEPWWKSCAFHGVTFAGMTNVSEQTSGTYAGWEIIMGVRTNYDR